MVTCRDELLHERWIFSGPEYERIEIQLYIKKMRSMGDYMRIIVIYAHFYVAKILYFGAKLNPNT